MAIDQEAQQRSITLPIQQVSAGTGISQLGNATAQVGQLITNKLNEVAIGQADTQGALDAESGSAPENLTMPFTKSTKAYNDAVIRTEARRTVISAQSLIDEALVKSKDPAKFNSNSPKEFQSSLEGIKTGLLKNARPEVKSQLTQAIDKLSADASINMLQHSIAFDNQQANANLKQDISGYLEARRNAAIAGDTATVSAIDQQINASIDDYSTMNAGIARIAPHLKKDIAKSQAIDTVLGGFSHAIENKTTAQFMSNLAENKEHLPYNVWQDAVKGVVALDQEHKRLKNDINAEQVAQVKRGIDTGSIQDAGDIFNYPDLTVPQQLASMTYLDNVQAKQMGAASKVITAQQNILSDRPTWNSGSQRDAMFESAIQAQEKYTGEPANLQQMSASVLGASQFPASGLPQTPMGTNVPAFDSVMAGQLDSKDPAQVAYAAQIYQNMVKTQNQPNSVNLTGQPLAVATLFNTLNKGGTTPEEAANLAINSVYNATEPQIAARVDTYHRTFEKLDGNGVPRVQNKFKEAFGLSPQIFGSGEALKVFEDTFRTNYLASNSEQAAFDAAKYSMRSWGTSKYFDKGYVGNAVPEKELPITQVGNAFGNQMTTSVQGYINRTAALKAAHPELGIPTIEWADPKQTIKGDSITPEDKVFKKLTIGDLPRIKINGHESDVVLIPSASSRLSNGVNYILGSYDKFNNLVPLKDISNQTDQVARFQPQELSLWSPEIATKQTDEKLRQYATSVLQKETQQRSSELKELERKNPAWGVILGLGGKEEYLQYIANRNAESSEGRLEDIVQSLRGASGSKATRDAITDADNVGISNDIEPPKGNK